MLFRFSRFQACLFFTCGAFLFAAEPGPRRLEAGNAEFAHAVAPGEIRTFYVRGADDPVTWNLVGAGRMQLDPQGSHFLQYRATRAGGYTSRLTATSDLDPSQTVTYVIQVGLNPAPPAPPKVDLLPLLTYDPVDRNQGSCSNCYAWAATAALEVELAARYGIRERLSVQYFNSIYKPTKGDDPVDPCQANSFSAVLEHYNLHRMMIPWSNPHADFKDRGGSQGARKPIGLFPHHRVRHIESKQVETLLWSDEEIIDELKHVLCQQRAVIAKTGGHYVVLVGYNAESPDPALHHWKVLDSNGDLATSPGMLHDLPMRPLDYNQLNPSGAGEGDPGGGRNRFHYQFDYVDRLDLEARADAFPVTRVSPAGAALQEGEPLELAAAVEGKPPVSYQWTRDGRNLPGQTRSVLSLPLVGLHDAGNYAVVASNALGTESSDPVRVTVAPLGAPFLSILPVALSMGTGGLREFTAVVQGLSDSRVIWTLAGAGELLDRQANPVTFRAPDAAGSSVLKAEALAAPALTSTVSVAVKSTDLNGDGVLDVLDLADLAKAFRSVRGDANFLDAADLNGDGIVGADDAMEFLLQLDARP